MQLRQMVKVGSAGRDPLAQPAKTPAPAPWQIDQARRKLNGWDPEGVGRAEPGRRRSRFREVAKRGGRDPVYAVERAILTICRARKPR